MDPHDRRRKRLEALVGQWGGVAALARRLGYANGTFISQILGGKPLGEKAARSMETKLGLAPGWFDAVEEVPAEPAQVDAVKIAMAIRIIGEEAQAAQVSLTPELLSELVAFVYEAADPAAPIDRSLVKRTIRLLTLGKGNHG